MKHASSRVLFNYWKKQKGDRPAPARAEIDPGAIRYALADVFMLSADFVEERRFRLAGTKVCALFCRELKGDSFVELWSESIRQQIKELVEAVTAENIGIVAGVRGRAADASPVDLELLLLPLAFNGLARVRAIGVLAAADLPYWIGEKPVETLELVSIRHVSPELDPPNTRRFLAGRIINQKQRRFMVYDGGLMKPADENPSEKAG